MYNHEQYDNQMTNASHRLREGITLYSAVLENPDAHMQLLADAANLIDNLTRKNDELNKWESAFGHLGTADQCGNEWLNMQSELEEQARLLGISSERECSLLGKVERLEKQRNQLLAAAQAIVNATGIFNMIDYPEIVIEALEACEEAIANVKGEVE